MSRDVRNGTTRPSTRSTRRGGIGTWRTTLQSSKYQRHPKEEVGCDLLSRGHTRSGRHQRERREGAKLWGTRILPPNSMAARFGILLLVPREKVVVIGGPNHPGGYLQETCLLREGVRIGGLTRGPGGLENNTERWQQQRRGSGQWKRNPAEKRQFLLVWQIWRGRRAEGGIHRVLSSKDRLGRRLIGRQRGARGGEGARKRSQRSPLR